MEILTLLLVNFRNFPSKKIEFQKKISVIIGPNGSGKSNILEAVGLLSGIRSRRVETDLDFVRFGKSETKVEGEVFSESKKTMTINFLVLDPSTNSRLPRLDTGGQAGQVRIEKAYFIDSLKKRLVDFIPYLSMIVFEPLDLDLVSGAPSLRRHHLDGHLASLDRDYWRNLSAYNKIMVRRNKVLVRIAEGRAKAGELDFWDGRLVVHGKYISQKREEFFEFLNFIEPTFASSSSQKLSGWANLSWELKQSLVTYDKLLRNRERDIAAGVTLSGPHRDDFRFLFAGRDLAFFGSRGEQRMAVLALKLSELEYYQKVRGVRPVLALDDIFSELDSRHREAVFSVVDKQQTVITAAEKDSVPKQILKKAKVIELK